MKEKGISKVFIYVLIGFVIGSFSFLSDLNVSYAKVNRSNVSNSTDKRIMLEAAHGAGYDGCNHMSAVASNGVRYYENLEAREMINLIAGYLDQAGLKYEIANELAGDSYFNDQYNPSSGCSPGSGDCCGFKQGVIGNYSPATYKHVDEVGADKYLFAFELHFNAGGGTYAALAVEKKEEPYTTNGQKIIDAVDKVMGTTNSRVMTDIEMFSQHTTLGTVTNFSRNRNIPVYYLETFFMDYSSHMDKYPSVKDDLAREIATALVSIAGESANFSASKGLTEDPFVSFPSLFTGEFTCRAIFMDEETGELNDVGKLFQGIFTIIKIAAPVLTVCLSTIDYIKALVVANESMKKTNVKVAKRVIIGLCLFLLPYILDLLFHIFGLYDLSRCNIG